MKRLAGHNDKVFMEDHFFNEGISNKKIAEWVSRNLHILNLNEEHSCSVNLEADMIVISGDEDRVEIDIIDIVPVM